MIVAIILPIEVRAGIKLKRRPRRTYDKPFNPSVAGESGRPYGVIPGSIREPISDDPVIKKCRD